MTKGGFTSNYSTAAICRRQEDNTIHRKEGSRKEPRNADGTAQFDKLRQSVSVTRFIAIFGKLHSSNPHHKDRIFRHIFTLHFLVS